MRMIAIGLLALATPVTAQVTPGRWQITSTVTAIDMPGVPAGALGMMKKPQSINHCVTPEEAKRGPQEMMKRDKSCRFTRYAMAGGKLDSQMQCSQGGGTMTITSRGTFTPTSFATSADIVGTGAQAMKMSVVSKGRLVGTCGK